MKPAELKDLPTEELLKKEKSLKTIVGMFIGILLILLVASIYLAITDGKFNASIVVALALITVLMANIGNLKNIRKEINSRN